MKRRLRTSSQRIPAAIILAALVIVLHAVLPASAIAEIGDISVGGIWVCQITVGLGPPSKTRCIRGLADEEVTRAAGLILHHESGLDRLSEELGPVRPGR